MIEISNTASTLGDRYPDLEPRRYSLPLEDVYDAALTAILDASHWKLSVEVPHERIAAERTTSLFRFVDDVNIEFRQDGDEVCVEVWSESRLGKYDFGQNAQNIREFFERLENNLAGQTQS